MSTPSKRQSPAFRWLVWPLLACWLSCVSPTLPPDDPPEPEVELGVGIVYLRGAVPAAPAFVLVHNRATGFVFGQRTVTGAYAFSVEAEACDALALWYETGSFQSTAITFFPAVAAGARNDCRDVDSPAADGGL